MRNHKSKQIIQRNLFYQFPLSKQLRTTVQHQIQNVKKLVQKSNFILQQSKRQSKSPQKIVPSDAFAIYFSKGEQSNVNKTIFDEIELSRKKDSFQQCEQEESEGKIQLPIHMNTSAFEEKNFFTERKQENHQRIADNNYTSREQKLWFKNQTSREKNIYSNSSFYSGLKGLSNSLQGNTSLKVNQSSTERGEISLKKNNLMPKSPMTVNGPYKTYFLKQKQINRSKQKLIKYRQNQKEKVLMTEKRLHHYLTQSHQNLVKIYNSDMSKQKYGKLQKKNMQKIIVQKQKQPKIKIKIKLNRPSGNQTLNNKGMNIRPRYQIDLPNFSHKQTVIKLSESKQKQSNVQKWNELKVKIQKYEFVKKYLTESQLYSIYEHLIHNKIAHQKWPLFVVDEAYKKMGLAGKR